jgi:hypothetical protein
MKSLEPFLMRRELKDFLEFAKVNWADLVLIAYICIHHALKGDAMGDSHCMHELMSCSKESFLD